MPVEPEDLKALREAVAAGPRNVELRLRLARRLLELEKPHISWHHCTRILAVEPDHLDALYLARDSAEACGVPNRAEAYAELIARIEGHKKPVPVPGATSRERIYKVRGRSLRVIRGGADDK